MTFPLLTLTITANVVVCVASIVILFNKMGPSNSLIIQSLKEGEGFTYCKAIRIIGRKVLWHCTHTAYSLAALTWQAAYTFMVVTHSQRYKTFLHRTFTIYAMSLNKMDKFLPTNQ